MQEMDPNVTSYNLAKLYSYLYKYDVSLQKCVQQQQQKAFILRIYWETHRNINSNT